MSELQENKQPFFRMIALCVSAIIWPTKFEENEHYQLNCSGAGILRRALVIAAVLVLASFALGWGLGSAAFYIFGPASSSTISFLQIGGALILLWATLAVRGWDIQTISGTTLIEAINQYVYRALCFIGTTLMVASLFWPTTLQP